MPRRSVALLFTCAAAGLCPAAGPAKVPAFDAVEYRSVGPAAGGRVSRAVGVPGDPLALYAATASGGVWKSADAGLTWKPIFDDQVTSSVGSIAVAASDPHVVYVGSGEANIRGNVSAGAGIFKSEDAGKTWKHVWKQAGQIGTITVHPKDPDTAFAAVLGKAFGPNPERGVYRTVDGGKSWARVLAVDADTGASDVCVDPNNPRVVFAGTWQTRRRPWELVSGGPGSGLHVSRDGGTTWDNLKKGAADNGLPKGTWGRVGVAVAPSNSQRVYAVIESDKGGLYRSDDGGKSWEVVNESRPLRQRAWYYSTLTVHPTNPDVVWAPQVDLLKSIDGGRTFKSVPGLHHGDHHDLWVDPKNPDRLVNANDGGVDLSADGGKTWAAPPLPVTQFYHVHADNRTPFHVMGCMQDLGSASGPSRTPAGGVALSDWKGVGGGEAGHCVSDPRDPNVVYAGEYGGILTRFDRRTGVARNVTVNQTNPSGIDPAKHQFRFQWTAPVVVSVHEPGTVYHAGNVVFRTRDGGDTWDRVSPDLTRDDKRKQQWSGGPITGDNTGAETYCTVFALSESPKQKGLLWAGTDDGRVHVTKDGGTNWAEVTKNVPDMPDWGTVECIEASPHAAGTAFLVVDNHRMDDPAPHVWKTSDFGATWTKITAGLDAGVHCNAVREDPAKAGLLYLATERGVCVSPDAGATWHGLQQNLPTVPVADLVVKNDSLVLGTNGRSIWILDDLSVVRAGAKAAAGKPVFAYPVSPVTKSAENAGGRVSWHTKRDDAPNPPAGAVLVYTLAEGVTEVKLTVTDAAGRTVTTATGKRGVKPDEKDDDAPPKGGKV